MGIALLAIASACVVAMITAAFLVVQFWPMIAAVVLSGLPAVFLSE